MATLGQSLLRLAKAALKPAAARPSRSGSREATRRHDMPGQPRRSHPGPHPRLGRDAPAGRVPELAYDPQPGSTADPGEIVWTWVPYEDDPAQGKDRPVLIIGRDGGVLLALMLTSRDRNNGESLHEGYVDIGSGAWDRQGRSSEVYLQRVLSIDPQDVRRIGATLNRRLFDRVLARLQV